MYFIECCWCCFFLMIRRPPRSTQSRSSAASDVYKRQPTDIETFGCDFPGHQPHGGIFNL